MDVLVVTPEIGPYVRASRAADAVAALCKTLVQTGHTVTMAAPRYPAFEERGLLVARRLSPLELASGASATVFDGQLASGAKVVLFDGEGLFARDGVYGDASGSFADNAERFGFLCQAAVALAEQRRERGDGFDVIHAFDWPAAPALALATRPDGTAPRRVLTLTNTEDRGEFPLGKASALGMSKESRDPFVVSRKLSYLAMGTRSADFVVMGSPTVAQDVASKARPDPTKLLQECEERLTGIADGIDYSVFNPATDAAIKSRFSAEDVGNKGTCKTDVVRSNGLALDVARPMVVAFVESDEDAAGIREGRDALETMDLNLLLAGPAAASLRDIAEALGDRAAVTDEMGGGALRRLVSGADVALCPRAYATDSTLARVAQRYGAAPVGVAAGATLDAVVDADAALQTGTGFLAEPGGSLIVPLRRALAAYGSDLWPALRRRIMRLDLSWDRPARRYAQLYRPARAAAAAGG